MAFWMRARFSGRTDCGWLMQRETVAGETPATRATSSNVEDSGTVVSLRRNLKALPYPGASADVPVRGEWTVALLFRPILAQTKQISR